MEFNNEKELEDMISALSECEKVRRAGSVDKRGNIAISQSETDGKESFDIVNRGDTGEKVCEKGEDIHISLNHIMEYYIYATYFKPDCNVIASDKPYGRYFREYGNLCMQKERFKAAEAAYKDAICWNPVDLDSILGLAECYKHLNMLERYLIVTKEAYRYCCTRATMARYYRNMGYYYLSKYDPHTARCCYVYSNIYYHTDNADGELKYLEEALRDKTPDISIKDMQNVFVEKGIEPGPNPDTIGIVYRVGELMLEDKEYGLARDCFSIVYDITREEQLEKMLDELDAVLESGGAK